MKITAFDTETGGLDWFNPNHGAFLGSWADETGKYTADLSKPEETTKFLDALRSADVLVAHNLSYDTHMVRETLGFDVLTDTRAELHDTDTMSRVMFPEGQRKERGGHGLKHLATVHVDPAAKDAEDAIADMAKAIGLKTLKQTGAYRDVFRAYPEAMERYAADDAYFTRELFLKFRERITPVQQDVYNLEREVSPVLIRAEAKGIALDTEEVSRQKKLAEDRQAEVYDYLVKELGEQALGGEGSEEALIEALQSLGVPLYQKTDTGKLATNKFALQEFADDFPQIAAYQEHATAGKFLSTYIGPMSGRDTVHPSYMQIGAWTGRMSCRRPNMQNVPRGDAGPRRMFVPRPGHSFVVCDYDSIEIRLLAYYLNDPGFIELIEGGHDPHAWMAAQIHGGEMSEYFKGTPGQEIRDAAKNTLFAITYGAGGKRVSDMNNLDPAPYWGASHPEIKKARARGRDWPKVGWQYHEGRALASKIKGSLPKYYKLNSRIKKKIAMTGHVNTLFGRTNPVNPDKAYVGINALIQGSSADILKAGLVRVDEAVRPYGGIPLLVVHDEVVVEVPNENAEHVLSLTRAALESAYDLAPSLTVTGAITSTSYADAK